MVASLTIDRIYDIASQARRLNLDPDVVVEALPAGDLAARVEGLVGPPGIAAVISTAATLMATSSTAIAYPC